MPVIRNSRNFFRVKPVGLGLKYGVARRDPRGFTLIELLIVVAIIAILAAIAVPNFMEAQMRSKVSRSKSDMRTLGLAVLAYKVDNTSYPYSDWTYFWYNGKIVGWAYHYLTTPIAYVSSIPSDVFHADWGNISSWGGIRNSNERPPAKPDLGYQYECMNNPNKTGPFYRAWAHGAFGGGGLIDFELSSVGPCGSWSGKDASQGYLYAFGGVNGDLNSSTYDPTNGTVSWGHMFYCEKGFPNAR